MNRTSTVAVVFSGFLAASLGCGGTTGTAGSGGVDGAASARMHSTSCLRHAAILALALLLAVGLVGCLGRDGELAESEPGNALRQRFPDRATLVLEQAEPFVASGEGFALVRSSVRPAFQGVEVALPSEGREAIRFRGFGGAEVRVREIGAEGQGALAEHAVAYPRPGGTSFWTAAPGGVEEWLHLDASAVHAGEAAATWEVEEATVRQRGEGVEIVDAGGVVRLSVTAPVAYASGGREVGARLVASGARIELRLDADREAVLVDPLWVAAGSMIQPRTYHTAALLASGKVLVAGGYNGQYAEQYDPAINTWSLAGAMSQPRSYHSMTLLGNGQVLVAGGYLGGNYQGNTELYDPTTNTWSPAAPMIHARGSHTALLLGTGSVLVVGGLDAVGRLASAELYNPAMNTWSPAGPMIEARFNHTMTLLGSGKVLVTGGVFNSVVASAELFDPATSTWSSVNPMVQPRQGHTATLLGSGKVLIAGGYSGVVFATAELFDPVTTTWSPAGTMSQGHEGHTATLLGSGKVLVAAGGDFFYPIASANVYDPATTTWSPTTPLIEARYLHTATLLGSGAVLAAGGFNGSTSLMTAELYAPTFAPPGAACMGPGDCQSGFCADGVCCTTACNGGSCDACSVTAGAAVNGTCKLFTGPACNDGDSCTKTDSCQAGVCTGGNPVICAVPDQCHATSVCSPATGVCANSAKANGTACDDGNACTQSDTCQSGICSSGAAVICAPPDQCHTAGGSCDPIKGCTSAAKPDGAACDDGNACTQADTCQAGICAGGTAVICAPLDQCHSNSSSCDPVTGCSSTAMPDGTPCNGFTCTEGNSCQDGVCTNGHAVVCTALDTCHIPGKCDQGTGVCTNPAKPDTAVCDDGDACTQTDTCLGGVCKGANAVTCKPMDECHGDGTCDSRTGTCSTPAKPEGAPCADGSCTDGVCVSMPAGSSTSSGGDGAGGGSDSPRESGGCGCSMIGDPDFHPAWLGLGLLLVRRRRARRAPSPREEV